MSDKEVLGFLESYGQIKKGATTGREIVGLVGLAIKFAWQVLCVGLWLLFATAWWCTLLTRTRHGLLALLAFGIPSILTLTFFANAIGDGGGLEVIAYWWAALIFAWIVHVILAVVRVFRPSALHVHSSSGGESANVLVWFWSPIASRLRLPLVVAVLFSELMIVTAIAGIAALADWRWPPIERPAFIPAYAIPLMAAPGLIAQQLVTLTANAWRVSTLKDQESEQTGLSESLAKHPTRPAERAVEGVAEIPR